MELFDETRQLLPAIAQDHESGQVLMMAWMNADAFRETVDSGYATYYSRSRQKLWRKGEESGHRQRVISLHVDCDADPILLKVQQTAPLAMPAIAPASIEAGRMGSGSSTNPCSSAPRMCIDSRRPLRPFR